MRQLIGSGVQLGVAEFLILENHGHGFGALCYLLLKQLLDQLVPRIRRRRPVELLDHLPPLRNAQQRQLAHPFTPHPLPSPPALSPTAPPAAPACFYRTDHWRTPDSPSTPRLPPVATASGRNACSSASSLPDSAAAPPIAAPLP